MLRGEFGDEIYDPLVFNRKVHDAGYEGLWLSYAPNPPFTALLFIPLTLLPPEISKLIFNIFSVIAFLFSWRRLCRFINTSSGMEVGIPLLFLLPLANNIAFGQVYLLLFVLLSEGFLAIAKGRLLFGSFLWALAIIFKITPGILVLYLIARQRWDVLTRLAIAGSIILLISIAVSGWDVWSFFAMKILPRAGQGDATSAAFTINYQSAFMFFKYLFVAELSENPYPIFASETLFLFVTGAFKITVLILACLFTARVQNEFKAWTIWIVVASLISPYGNTYQYVLFAIPLLSLTNTRFFFPAVAICFLLANIPITYLYSLPLLLQFPRLWLCLFVFTVLLTLGSIKWNMYTVISITVLILTPTIFQLTSQKDNSIELIDKETPPLIMAYRCNAGKLELLYYENGKELKRETPIAISKCSNEDIRLVQNQIVFRDSVITSSGDTKRHVSLINDTTIVYLSDKGRGYGFLRPRMIPIPSPSLRK